ncbi:MAG: AAA-like domain-containing protein, partial [Elainellaceae cyanobacterium]
MDKSVEPQKAHNIYTPGGTDQAGQGIYLERQADAQLLQLCQEGVFAYVLTSRQMGKSSLMVHTARRLATEGVVTLIVDLTDVGVQDVTADAWYRGFLLEIEAKLESQERFLDTDVYEWWEAHHYLTVSQKLSRFFRHVLLEEVEGPVVVFVDEIDTTLSLDFTDDFFITIRSFYTARAQDATFQ